MFGLDLWHLLLWQCLLAPKESSRCLKWLFRRWSYHSEHRFNSVWYVESLFHTVFFRERELLGCDRLQPLTGRASQHSLINSQPLVIREKLPFLREFILWIDVMKIRQKIIVSVRFCKDFVCLLWFWISSMLNLLFRTELSEARMFLKVTEVLIYVMKDIKS